MTAKIIHMRRELDAKEYAIKQLKKDSERLNYIVENMFVINAENDRINFTSNANNDSYDKLRLLALIDGAMEDAE